MAEVVPTADERVDLMRMALAETGYPDAPVHRIRHPMSGEDTAAVLATASIPLDVVWRAFRLIDFERRLSCFECWKALQTHHWQGCELRGEHRLDCGAVGRPVLSGSPEGDDR